MSVEYSIRSLKNFMPTIDKLLEDWANESPKFNVFIDKTSDSSKYIVFSKGSIRGFTITFGKKLFYKLLNIRMNACASFTDWEALFRFLVFLRKKNNITIFEEGILLKSNDITFERFTNRAKSDANSTVNLIDRLLENQEYIKLPIWDFDVVIYKKDYVEFKKQQDYSEVIISYLQEKSYNLMHSRRAAIIEVESKNLISVWNYDDAIIQKVNFVALNNPLEKDETLFIKWDDFVHSPFTNLDSIPRDKGQEPYFFINRLDEEIHTEVFESFKSVSVDMNEV